MGVQQPLGAIAPGATVTTDAQACSPARKGERMLEKIAPPGLELVKIMAGRTILAAAVLAAGEAARLPRTTGAGSIIALTVPIKLVSPRCRRPASKSMGKHALTCSPA
ncbi:hypothetical protein ACU4GD_31390 [Cupriavidus basilensis]